MLNQSDPVLLAGYLSTHYNNDYIYYTNIGMPQYMQYISADRLKGEDIMDWHDPNGFANGVKLALLRKDKRRVFVAVARERDGGPGALPRTKLLYSLLERYNIPYSVTPLSNEHNRHLYEIVVVDKGATLQTAYVEGMTLRISDVTDVRVQSSGEGKVVIGSVIGLGFKPGDTVVINGDSPVPTAFGNEKWITFSFPVGVLNGKGGFSLAVLRLSTLERTKPFSAQIGKWS